MSFKIAEPWPASYNADNLPTHFIMDDRNNQLKILGGEGPKV